MTGLECDNFEKRDKKEYIVKKNRKFLEFYSNILKEDYHSYLDLDRIQNLINNITKFYEFKYPDRFFDTGIDERFKNIKDLSKYIDFDQLRYRLNHDEIELLDCNYRGQNIFSRPYYQNHNITYNDSGYLCFEKTDGFKNYISIKIYDKREKYMNSDKYLELSLCIDDKGLSEYNDRMSLMDVSALLPKETLTAEFIQKELSKYAFLDISELNKVIKTNKLDKELRNRIINLAAINMLYSKNTGPEYGYERSKLFIKEINKYYNINIKTTRIDEIMNTNYKEDITEKKEQIKENKKRRLLIKKNK